MFYDVRRMNYEKLKQITKDVSPLRGSDAYPLGQREYSDRHFRPLKDEEGFALYYGNRRAVDEIIKKGTGVTTRLSHTPFAIVRADNSIEFLRDTGLMSENLLLQNLLSSGVYHSKAHGGTIIKQAISRYSETPIKEFKYSMHPMFVGLRINMDTLEAMTPYEFYRRKLNRVQAKSYLEQFEETKKTGIVMLKAMTHNGINELIKDLRNTLRNTPHSEYSKKFYESVDNKYHLDALMYFVLLEQNYWWDISNERLPRFIKLVTDALSKKFNDFVLKNSDVGLDLVKLESGELFESCKWGYKIVCNGQETKRL